MAGESFDRAFAQANLGLALLDQDGRYTWVNQRLCDMFGVTSESLVGTEYDCLTHPDDRGDADEHRERKLWQHRESYQREKRYRHTDGSDVWGILSVTMLEGGPPDVLIAVQEITRRKREERVSVAGEELVRLLQRLSLAAIEAQQFEDLLQLVIEEVVAHTGWPIGHVFVPDGEGDLVTSGNWVADDNVWWAPFREATESARFARGQGLPGRVWETGEPVWFTDMPAEACEQRATAAAQLGLRWGVGFPVKVAGELAAVIEFFSASTREADPKLLDVMGHVGTQLGVAVERQRARDSLMQRTRDYRSLFENAHDAILIFSPVNTAILEVNPRACEQYGYTRNEFVGLTLEAITRDMPSVRQHIEETLTHGATVHFEREDHTRDGSTLFVEVTASLMEYGGQPAILSLNRDVTQRRGLERQLLEADKLDALGQLAGGVAHEFNNILTTIIGFTDLSRRRLGGDHPLNDELHEIDGAARKARGLTTQLLAFSRSQLIQPSIQHLNMLISERRPLIGVLVGEAVDLDFQLFARPDSIRVDPGQLEQVLINLVINARDAIKGGGSIHVGTLNAHFDHDAPERPDGLEPGSYVALCVRDDGCGMDVETRGRVFEPFYTTKPPGEGTGLGLSVAYGIVRQAGGHITVESELEEGSRLCVYFREEVAPAKPRRISSKRIPLPSGTETVLIVEDQPAVRRLTREVLELAGFTVIDAENGVDALSLFEQDSSRFDLLLTDVVMPKMDGRQLVKRAREIRPDVPVLFMSGYSDDVQIRADLADFAFLQKPFTPTSLTIKVREVLDEA